MKTTKPYGHGISVEIRPLTTASIAIIVISLLMFVGNFNIYKVEADASLPPGITASVQITLTNNQAVATLSPFQQMIQINSSVYSSKEALNLQNVEFFDGNGNIIPSWLESGNSNSSTNTIYWLKLANGISAYSSITIYLGFADTTTNLFNVQSTGEAPQLSASYGEYDNGTNIFNYYDNFVSTLSSWNASTGVSTSVSSGLTINFSQNGYLVGPTEGAGTAFDADVTSDPAEINIGYINTGETTSYLGGPAWASSVVREACNNTYPDQMDQKAEANPGGNISGSIIPGTEIKNGIFSIVPFSPSSSFQCVNYSIGNSTQPITNNAPQYPCQVGFTQMRSGNLATALKVQWARVRVAPPNGVMPLANVGGNFSSTTAALTSSANPSVSGQPVTFTDSLSPIPDGGTVQFQDSSTNLGAPVTIDNSGQAVYTTSTLSLGNHSITAIYSGDVDYSSSSSAVTQVLNTPTPPSINFVVTNVTGLCVSVNGGTLPTAPGATITGIVWNWGDGQTMAGWMLQNHTYGAGGTYTIMATSTDSNGQSQSASTVVTVSGTATQTKTALSSSINPSVSYQSVTLIASISPIPDGGTVLFQEGSTCISSPTTINSNGQAIFTTSYLTIGSQMITATYSGDANFASSSGTITQVVNTTSAPAILLGTPVISGLCISINGVTLPNAPGATITGIIWNWGDGQTMAGWFPETHTYNQGGTYTITATSTDSNGQSQSASTVVTVSGTATTTATALTSSINPSVSYQSVTFTASISPDPDGGTVLFQDNNTSISAPIMVIAGLATFTTSTLSAGSHSIMASYSGDNNFASSSSTLTQSVNTLTYPGISLDAPNVKGASVTIDGNTFTSLNAYVTKITWDWGDGQITTGWFPQTHTYMQSGNYTIVATAQDTGVRSNAASVSVAVTVTLSSITVKPASCAILGDVPTVRQFFATATYSDGTTADVTSQANWTSSDTTKATITSPGGLATSVAPGTTNITATLDGVTSPPATLNVEAPSSITSITIAPASQTILTVGVKTPFYIIVTFADGSIVRTTSQVTWTSSDTTKATITTPGGVATGVAPGTINITATLDGVSSSVSLTVSPVVLSSIVVTNSQTYLAFNFNVLPTPLMPFTATGLYSDGSTSDISYAAGITWTSDNTEVADFIPGTALAEGKALGTANITASLAGITSLPATLTIVPKLNSIVVTSPSTAVAVGSTAQFIAAGIYSDGSSANITSMVGWTSSDSTKATITSLGGLAVGLAAGTANITATMSGVTSPPVSLAVDSSVTLSSISVAPASPVNLIFGSDQQFTATGTYSNGTTSDITKLVTWASDNNEVATITTSRSYGNSVIGPGGLASGIAAGTANIIATLSGVTSLPISLKVISAPTPSIATCSMGIAGGYNFTIGLKSNGTVIATGENGDGECDVSAWTGIIQVAVGTGFTIGLKSDGTVVAVGNNGNGQCNVNSWTGITQIAAGSFYSVGLKSDGTVVTTSSLFIGDLSSWQDIIQVASGSYNVVGLKKDGTVVAAGYNTYGECNVGSWNHITQVACGMGITVGLRSDGTVVALGNNADGQCNVGSWNHITQVAVDNMLGQPRPVITIGLESDGTVVTTSSVLGGKVSSWKDIIRVAAGWNSIPLGASSSNNLCTFGLKSDGTVVTTSFGPGGDVGSWNLGCGNVTSIQNGGASVTQNNGVAVSINGAGSNAEGTNVTIASLNNGNTSPSGAGSVSLDGSQYYDINVSPVSNLNVGAMAEITITSLSITANSTIQYWYNGGWNTASNIAINTSVSPPTISGEIPVSALTGTPLAIGAPLVSSTSGANATVSYNASDQLVNLTAIINSYGVTVNEGTVTFTITNQSGTIIGSAAKGKVTNGTANLNYTLPGGTPVGLYFIEIDYSGGPDFTASNDINNLMMNKANTTPVETNKPVTYSGNNQIVNLTATVSSNNGKVNEGTVKFTIEDKNNTAIGKPVTSGTVSSGNANASYTLPGGTPAGTYKIVTAYSGGTAFNSSSDSTSQLIVNQAPDQTFVISIPNPSVYGSQVTFTAVVLPSSINPANIIASNNGSSILNTSSLATILGNYIPTGSITFMDGTTTLGTVKLSKLGFVTFTTSSLAAGNHPITAKYSGDTNYLSSISGTLTQKINKANTTISLTSTPNPTNSKTTVTFTATLNSTVATGTITFMSGSTILGTGPLPLVNGKAILKTTLSSGNYSITAVYGGDANFNGCTSNIVKQVITK